MFLQVSVCPWGGIMYGRGRAWQGVFVAGGVCVAGGMHCMHTPPPRQILQDTVNEWAVRILLECILF